MKLAIATFNGEGGRLAVVVLEDITVSFLSVS
jgi:hypothetical protein